MGNFFSDNTEKITNNTEDNNILQTDVASNMIIDTYNTYNSHTDNIIHSNNINKNVIPLYLTVKIINQTHKKMKKKINTFFYYIKIRTQKFRILKKLQK